MTPSPTYKTSRAIQETLRYYYRTGLSTFVLIPLVLLILAYTVFDMATSEHRYWIQWINSLMLFVWGFILLNLIWLLFVDKYNLSYIEILEDGIKKRNGYLKAAFVSFNETFIYKESKGDIKAIKVYSKSKKRLMTIGNAFELSPSEIKTLIQERKTAL